MNDFLAQLYGTGSEVVEETEKTAEAVLLEELEKVASEEGIDLNELSDDDIVEILSEALSAGEGAEEKTASEELVGEYVEQVEDEGLTEEDTQKLAEADFLGRTMAHAFFAELSEIGKEAQAYEVEDDGFEYYEDEDGNVIKVAAGSKAGLMKKLKYMLTTGAKRSGKKALKHMAKHPGKYVAGGTAAGMGAGYLMGKGKGKKKESADEAVLERANAILEAASEQLDLLEKQSSDEDALNEAALELLAQNEYDVERIVGLLSDEE